MGLQNNQEINEPSVAEPIYNRDTYEDDSYTTHNTDREFFYFLLVNLGRCEV